MKYKNISLREKSWFHYVQQLTQMKLNFSLTNLLPCDNLCLMLNVTKFNRVVFKNKVTK